jgi:rare lipoprotein A
MAPSKQVSRVIEGTASWYGPGFFGNRTASGEVFRPGTLTAAHRSLPFGTMVRVTNLNNGRSTVVRINDRGPFVGNRVIDLGHGAAQQVGLVSSGVAPVRLEVLR